MKTIQNFIQIPFIEAVEEFYKGLNIPVNVLSTLPTTSDAILGNDNFKDLIEDVYPYGIINDAVFDKENTFSNIDEVKTLKSDYEGILLFGITLKSREHDLLPTRSQLADITRAVNKAFPFTPVNIIFKYGKYIALANTERTQYKQTWREGEKLGKVSLLRDIDCKNIHSGHIRILQNLEITRSGKNAINNFDSLYKYWQEVLSVSILNKVFYRELQNWYFWAIKEVRFPDEPLQIDFDSLEKYDEALKEHKGKNVIRLLTRLLFIWFIKEKGLIPEEIFDEKEIAKNFIDGFTPQKPEGMFANGKYSSKYYRAILQNLFFATLNQPRNEREFRSDGKHLNATQLMRYKSYLKNPEYFIELMESKVPFMNGGLFECLDKPHPTLKGPQGGDRIMYVDGFSDRPDNELVVPDFLFFDADEEVDLSAEYGNAKAKKEKTRGLFTILKSYKFTITENTPIDEEVALDPELLGKVFENLLASYNPETKTTARKQTGSFYTPREIVNYMVEESLIAYLKNELLHEEAGVQELGKKQIALFGNETKAAQLAFETKVDESPFKGKEDELDVMLHQLVSYSEINPFIHYPEVNKKIIKALDNCKILDPACGSGAYPMGILQKMVHILHKIDPNNTEWKQRQIDRVNEAIERLELLDDVEFKNKGIKELKTQILDIEEAFANNELDYGRKLYLIENCIYGVDIQPIATQISKLRFFISLVVDQKVDAAKDNFGVRPLPNLETKFVAANTLISLPKQKAQGSLFDKREVKKLEEELKKVRHKLFSVKTPSIKRELRIKDKELRELMSEALAEQFGNETAQLLAKWDPYDQNTSSPFFDTEWMFDITKGFDIVIGNPPYYQLSKDISVKKSYKDYLKVKYQTSAGRLNLFIFFIHEALNLAKKENGVVSYIIPNTILTQEYYTDTRKKILKETCLIKLVNYDEMPFENAVVENITFVLKNKWQSNNVVQVFQDNLTELIELVKINQNQFLEQKNYTFNINSTELVDMIISDSKFRKLSTICEVNQGIALKGDKSLSLKNSNPNKEFYKLLDGRNINKYKIEWNGVYLDYNLDRIHSCKSKDIFTNSEKLLFRRVSKNLIFTYDDKQFFALNTIVVVNKKSDCNENLKALLAILNSDILNFIYNKQFKSTKKVFSEIQARSVKELPIPKISHSTEMTLSFLTEMLLFKNTDLQVISSVSNAIVNELYFTEHMKERNIDVLTFVNKDINDLMQGRIFENLSDIEKDDVIENLYSKWNHPDNEVRNRIKLFAVRSPEILKPILEN